MAPAARRGSRRPRSSDRCCCSCRPSRDAIAANCRLLGGRRRRRAEPCEVSTRTRSEDDVALALGERESLQQALSRFGNPTGGGQDLGQVGQRVRVRVEHVGLLEEGDGVEGEPLGLTTVAGPRAQLCAYLPPERLRNEIVGAAELLGELRLALGFCEPAELVERLAEASCRRRAVARVAELLEQPAACPHGALPGARVACEYVDLPGRHAADCNPDRLSELVRCRVAGREQRARLVEASAHRLENALLPQRDHVLWPLLLVPAQHLFDGCGPVEQRRALPGG